MVSVSNSRQVADLVAKVRENVQRVIVGKDESIELALVALLCRGHILVEDVPGIGKTTLSKALAQSLGCTFKRIQFTPDLMPSDVLGVNFFNQKTSEFEFLPGPIVSQILLADEINRATPRTQSALLEAMQERQTTVDGVTRALPKPFLVLATQNPIEMEGTFPLPEAQLDRFLLRLRLGYPTKEEDREILGRFKQTHPIDALEAVVEADQLLEMGQTVRGVLVDADIEGYIVDIVHRTRDHAEVELGASPRAMLGLYRASQALAALRGRTFVTPDDVKYLAPFALEHRIIPKAQSHLRGQSAGDILRSVVESVAVPVERVAEQG